METRAAVCRTRSPTASDEYRSVTNTTVAGIPTLWGSRTHRRLRCTPSPESQADGEARVGWVWAVVVVWVLLAVPAAVLLGRAIHRADREELEAPAPDPDQVPRRPARTPRPGRDPLRDSSRGMTAA